MKALSGKTQWTGVMGWPVSHSLSPVIHNRWFAEEKRDAVYIPLPVRPDAITTVMPALAQMGCVGVNLTIPHKELVIPLLDHVDETARRIGAVNTVVIRDGKLHGHNTDAYGFMKSLETDAPKLKREVALVVGAGGGARAVVAALSDAGFKEILLMNRTPEKAKILESLSDQVRVIPWSDNPVEMKKVTLVVNTTSLGMIAQPPLNLNLEMLPKDAVVTDLVYSPLITPLLQAAQDRGLHVVDGLGMLLYQAQRAFSYWFGSTPKVDKDLRRAVLIAMDSR